MFNSLHQLGRKSILFFNSCHISFVEQLWCKQMPNWEHRRVLFQLLNVLNEWFTSVKSLTIARRAFSVFQHLHSRTEGKVEGPLYKNGVHFCLKQLCLGSWSSLRTKTVTPKAKILQGNLYLFHFCVFIYFLFASKFA